jgi:endonuclease/exonuclease/phosphatase family metal-dependent hydrolase
MGKNQAWLVIGCACVALVFGTGCGDDDEIDPIDSGTPDSGPGGGGQAVLRIATFNAGLLETVGFVDARQPHVNDALAELDAHVLCVQEVWQDEHWESLVQANEDVRPNAERIEPMPGVAGLCSPEELIPVRMCAELMCDGMAPEELFACTVDMCPSEVGNLTSTCTSCLIDNGASGDLDIIEAACLGAGTPVEDLPLPPEERSYLLGGAFGIGLLSSLPLMETDSIVLDSSTTRRGILYAKIDAPELGEIAIFCTHLSAVLNEVRYEGSYETWEGENTEQLAEMIAWVDEKTDDGDKVVMLGDLNTSPVVSADDIEGEVPDSYAQIPEAGFDNALLAGPNAICTFCSSNPLVRSDDTGVGAMIDHIVTRGIDTEVTSERILDDVFSVTDEQDGGIPGELPLSDHYGVRATFFDE